jgi:hypothetical protein
VRRAEEPRWSRKKAEAFIAAHRVRLRLDRESPHDRALLQAEIEGVEAYLFYLDVIEPLRRF